MEGGLIFISVTIWMGKLRFISTPICKGKLRFISSPTSILMSPKKVDSYLESIRISVKGTTIKKISLLSYSMRGDYTLILFAYGVHHRGGQFVEIIETPSDK